MELVALLLLLVDDGLGLVELLLDFWFLGFGCCASVAGVALVSRFLLLVLFSFWSCSGKKSLNVIGVS